MPILLFLTLGLSIAAGVMALNPTREQEIRIETQATAENMAWYHAMAVRQCSMPSTCAGGPVTVTAPLGSSMNPNTLSRSFVSATNGNIVVTTVTAGYAAGSGHRMGILARAIRETTMGSALAGPYDLANQSVSGTTFFRQSLTATNYTANMSAAGQAAPLSVSVSNTPGMSVTAPATTYASPASFTFLAVPSNVGGLSLENNRPVMATRVTYP